MSVPTTAKELEAFRDAHKAAWPADLLVAAHRAILSLKSIDLNKNNKPAKDAAERLARPDLAEFVRAYEQWKGGQ